MNSLTELNAWGATGVPFEDTRPTQATFTVPQNQVIWASESEANYALPQGIDVVSAQSISANSTYTLSGVPSGHSIAWTTPLPQGVASSQPSIGTYRLTGPLVPAFWQQVRQPTVQTTGNVSGQITANLDYGSSLSTQCTVDLVYPYEILEWSFGNTVSDVNNGHDAFQVTGTLRGSAVDPIVSTGATGNIANINQTQAGTQGNIANISVVDSGGTRAVTVTGNITLPYSATSGPGGFVYSLASTANLSVELKTTGNVSLPMPAPRQLKFSVDGILDLEIAQVSKGSQYSFLHGSSIVAASGKNEKWPMVASLDWPSLVATDFVFNVWIVDGIVSNASQFTSKTTVTGSLVAGSRAKLLENGVSHTYYPITVSTAVAQPSYTWPSIVMDPWQFSIVVEQGGGNPWPIDGTLEFVKTLLAPGSSMSSRAYIFSA